MRSPSPGSRRDQAGSVTAEFATVIPAVVLVLVCCLGGVRLATDHLVLQDAAADAARIVARGEGLAGATARARLDFPQAAASRVDSGGLVCVTLSSPAEVTGFLPPMTLTASSCALAGDR